MSQFVPRASNWKQSYLHCLVGLFPEASELLVLQQQTVYKSHVGLCIPTFPMFLIHLSYLSLAPAMDGHQIGAAFMAGLRMG